MAVSSIFATASLGIALVRQRICDAFAYGPRLPISAARSDSDKFDYGTRTENRSSGGNRLTMEVRKPLYHSVSFAIFDVALPAMSA